MRCFRLYENLSTRSPSGFGPAAGRWNHLGTLIIYASNGVALPFLELYSIKGPAVAKASWIMATLEIPDDLPYFDIENLPLNWNHCPPASSTKNFGTVGQGPENFWP